MIGEIIASKDKCNMCTGNKIIEENKTLDVVILPGCSNGKKMKFRGENDQLVRLELIDFQDFDDLVLAEYRSW
jgi:DnaJ family protein A protein 2